MANTTSRRVGAVVVTWFPDQSAGLNIAELATMVSLVAVVDNTPGGDVGLAAAVSGLIGVKLMVQHTNTGIARAINIGAACLWAAECDYVYLFDQDSKPTREMIERIPALMEQQSGSVAQIGPAYYDSRLQQVAPFVTAVGMSVQRHPAIGGDLIAADYLITSGACISAKAWAAVGPMDEELFIDVVDIEWGLRARAKGWQSYGWPGAVMQHCLGDEPISVFGRKYPVHSPIRHYYFFRNTIALFRRSYVPLNWKVIECYKIPLRFAVYALFTQNRRRHISMMLKGLWHGLLGRSGQLSE